MRKILFSSSLILGLFGFLLSGWVSKLGRPQRDTGIKIWYATYFVAGTTGHSCNAGLNESSGLVDVAFESGAAVFGRHF